MDELTIKRPLLLVVSAPSGGGKTTLCKRLLVDFPTVFYSVSCTTRAPRAGETDGVAYFFLTPAEFQQRLDAGAFLETAQVHDHSYGTPRAPVEAALSAGRDVLMDIDVQGAARIRQLISSEPGSILHRAYVDIFIAPPSVEVLKQRLTGRASDSEETIRRRLKNAEQELSRWREYQYFVVNDRLDDAYERLKAVVVAEHCRIV